LPGPSCSLFSRFHPKLIIVCNYGNLICFIWKNAIFWNFIFTKLQLSCELLTGT
jgi:hypothetical protein